MPINIANAKGDTKTYSSYTAWKAAVRKIDSKASFTGDKDIDSAFQKDSYDAEWSGDSGVIYFF